MKTIRKPKPRRRNATVRLSPEMYERVKQVAAENGRSVPEQIEWCIERYAWLQELRKTLGKEPTEWVITINGKAVWVDANGKRLKNQNP